MSNTVLTVARDEWRYWQRSRLAQSVVILAFLLAVASVWVTHASVSHSIDQRQHQQAESEAVFEALKNPRTRYTYDEMLKVCVIVSIL